LGIAEAGAVTGTPLTGGVSSDVRRIEERRGGGGRGLPGRSPSAAVPATEHPLQPLPKKNKALISQGLA
jgi:hypothetical protein